MSRDCIRTIFNPLSSKLKVVSKSWRSWQARSIMAYVVHAPKTHFSDTFKALESLYNQKDLCDVILKTEDAQFYAHKVVLVACCRYFAAMFRSGMAESQKSEVVLHDVDPVALECVLALFYTGQVTITSDNVQSLLSAASLFQIDHLVSACLSFLKQQLSPSNCLGIKSFAELHNCQFLVEAAERYSLARFTEVSCENEFLELTFDEVSSLTSNNKLKSKFCLHIQYPSVAKYN